MVGIQCKSCGHRALATPEPPKPDYEIIAELRQSSVVCGDCGGSTFHLLSLTAGTADEWLKG